ncbi:MAG TPA: ATP-binding protein [Vicinamibacterales bacterium]|nr:ATP-binding protein [Vicinamibacterales bacterium]
MKVNRKLIVGALTLGVLLILAGWRAVDLRRSRGDVLAAADARAQNLAHILAEYLSGAFAAGDAALRQLAVHGTRIGGVDAPGAEWLPILTQARAGLTAIGAISVADLTGTIRHSTRPEIVGAVRDDWTMRQGLSEPDSDTLIVGPAMRAVVEPYGYLIPLARRLRGRDGSLEGLVVASFLPDQLGAFFRSVDVGPSGTVWVFHPSGHVLVREPSPVNALGERAAGNPVFDAAVRQPQAAYRGAIVEGGPVQRVAFESVGSVPLSVAVSLDEDDVLAAWRRDVQLSMAAIIGVALLFGATLTGLFRQMTVADAAERTLGEARTAEAAHLLEAHEQLEAALAQAQAAKAAAERASALKDEFLMTVSHELRTPLGVILTGATVLGSDRLPSDQRTATLEAIKRNARAQARLVDDLLDVSRGMAGTLRLEVEPVSVGDLVQGAVETVGVAADAKGVRLTVAIEPAVGTIAGDGARLQQVVWNLLSNAVKFTAAGGEVMVRAAREASSVLVIVEDTGIGISPEFLPHVFDRFRQEHTGATRRYGGLGLGLAIARHLVELHGGEIAVHSEGHGRGARFTLRLPAAGAYASPSGGRAWRAATG